MHQALAAQQWQDVETLIGEEWKLRRTNAPGISTPLIDKLMSAAMANGGLAGKVCGAGGGGCVIVLIEKGTRQQVEQAIREHGGEVLNFQVAPEGLRFHSAKKGQTATI
jgi:D-glycero-alpha-D-manno-heptose-7-phosphate kinase